MKRLPTASWKSIQFLLRNSINSLKSLTRLRDRLIRQRSFYLVKLTNVLDHTFPEFNPFFHNRFSKTALYLLENYGSAEKMARMNSASYEELRSISRGKFTPQHFLKLKELAINTVGVHNSIFDVEMNSLLTLYKSLEKEIITLETEINRLIEELHPHYLSIPGIGPMSAAVIYAEYGDISNFSKPSQMLAVFRQAKFLKISKIIPQFQNGIFPLSAGHYDSFGLVCFIKACSMR